MFYEAAQNAHGLPHDPFKALVAPRPIGWISTQSPRGELNLAPYSFFNAISEQPKLVLFSSLGRKDSVTFAEEAGEFVANFASAHLAKQMNQSSIAAPRGVSEFDLTGLTPEPSRLVGPPRIREAYAALECKVTQIFVPQTLGEPSRSVVVIGQVVGIHIDETILTEGLVDVHKARPLSRLGYMDFAEVSEVFAMLRPMWTGSK
jgi:flavin reductase (DIM6/NTAB) family NADH-FMN oxidoreductase RutF